VEFGADSASLSSGRRDLLFLVTLREVGEPSFECVGKVVVSRLASRMILEDGKETTRLDKDGLICTISGDGDEESDEVGNASAIVANNCRIEVLIEAVVLLVLIK
jgi:hypothetical protein